MVLAVDVDPAQFVGIGTASSVLLGIFVWFLRDSARQDRRVDAAQAAQNRGLVHQLEETRLDRDRANERLERCQTSREALQAENTRLVIEIAVLRRRLGIDPLADPDGIGEAPGDGDATT